MPTKLTSAKVIMSRETRDAYRVYAEFRHVHFGFAHRKGIVKILTQPTDNAKLDKSVKPTWGLSLAPNTMAREYCKANGIQVGYRTPNQCPHATVECTAHCLEDNGNGRFDTTKLGRVCKTVFQHCHPDLFGLILLHEVRSNLAKTLGECLHRFNVISDRRWEQILPELFKLRDPHGRLIRTYDYTKFPALVRSAKVPHNYHLTYSATEHTTTDTIRAMVADGLSVAVVIRAKTAELSGDTWQGLDAINGDLHDDRSDDGPGVVLLSAKGTMRSSAMAKALATA